MVPFIKTANSTIDVACVRVVVVVVIVVVIVVVVVVVRTGKRHCGPCGLCSTCGPGPVDGICRCRRLLTRFVAFVWVFLRGR